MNPKVSVLLPTYNCAHLISDAIQSILDQTFKDFELLIVDDGSTDNTGEIVARFSYDARLKYHLKPNTGLGDTLNFGIDLSLGEYLIRMDSDDISLPDRFDILVNYMDLNPTIGMCGSEVAYFIENIHTEKLYYRKFPTIHEEIVDGLLNLSHAVCHPSIIFRKDVVMAAGKYQMKGVGEDLDFFLQMSKKGKLANINKCLYLMRMNPNSITHTRWAECYINYQFSLHRFKNDLDVEYLEDFKREFGGSFLTNLKLKYDAASLSTYRKGIHAFTQGNMMRYYFFVLLASLYSPKRVFNRIGSKIVNMFK
ncbi:glycosyltransferase family 2 protein [Pedobacter sp. GR22-6]|uniref:glycosyltransferase family 2 protein n=1 Tax=Pedobacter sp. GR22-6 TaxID=3127957 RepID=UPI00307F8B15